VTSEARHAPIDEANVWTAADLGPREAWAHRLGPEMVAEIAAAARRVRADRIAPEKITKDDFPLPVTAGLLARVYDELENGRGFAVVAGWPVDDFDYDQNVAAYCGIGAHLGRIKIQNHEGDWLTDVRDDGKPYSHTSRGYGSNKLLPFHTDGAELVGLLCLGEAARGGRSILVSATKVFNVILAERPDMMAVLERGFLHHRRRQHGPGESPVSERRIPVFAENGGFWHCCYNRNPIDWVEKEGFALSRREKEVLDFFDSVCRRPEMQVETEIRKGDLQFLNNYVILHSRTGFLDDARNRRHLVRLWLEDPASKRAGEGLLDLYVPGTSRYHRKAG